MAAAKRSGKNPKTVLHKAQGSSGPDKLCKTTICRDNPKGGRECWDVWVDCKIVDTLPKKF